ncbi:aquaporin [Cylindrobasidium torrendii FP15055 ss-10]|uniref:Aquaporin n=1 Tax=Cylindrobasidium torrendii FP15055 ss-10 TaxID=1314674 RepID=A0A0D7B3I0_9AGAR|nr:aquaporin [Cylindrobasidium torrendii FP15055 ss-10]
MASENEPLLNSSRSARRSALEGTSEQLPSPAPALPAAPVDADEATELHDPRWAEYSGRPNALTRFRYVWREELAEAFGTALIILFGAGVECQTGLHYALNKDHAYSVGDPLMARFAWAAGVAMAVWMAGGISGGHCNPSVTIALWMYRGFPLKRVPWYIGAQVFGGAMGALLVYANYCYSIALFENGSGHALTGPTATAGMFFTFPQPWLPAFSAFFSEALASGVLIAMVFALSDRKNLPPPPGTMAVALFIVLLGIGSSLGVNTGYAINGARDSGPRIALWLVGYGNEVWTHNSWWWAWGPWAGAIIGGIAGGFAYDTCIYTGRDSFLNRPVGGRSNTKIDDNV